jgi:ABC-2 type transport system ATP-binding protein
MNPIIQTENLTKFYGRHPGIKDLNLEINQGEIFGFLGPNGAGKSTTIRIILHLLKPTDGRVLVFGKDIGKNYSSIFKKTGNLPGELKLYEHLSGMYFLDFMNSFFGRPPKWRKEMAEAFKLDENILHKKIKYYSHGMKQKLGIIQTLQHDPDLIIMDEPTEGLDPLNKVVLYDYLRRFKDQGKTIFFSSHDLSEVEKICDRVGLVHSGKLIALEHINDLKEKMVRRMEIYFKEKYNIDDFINSNIEIQDKRPDRLIITVTGDVNPVIKTLANYDLKNLVFPEPSLEETFLQFYKSRDLKNDD